MKPDAGAAKKRKAAAALAALSLLVLLFTVLCLFVGSSRMGPAQTLRALFGGGSAAQNRIVWKIRVPRVLAALIAGAGLSLAGNVMQTCLGNPMASPSTLGVSHAAVFGANLSIIVFAGGFLSVGSAANFTTGANPFAVSLVAFLFSVLSAALILALCRLGSLGPSAIVLAGIAVGAFWTAATTILQFCATDVGLSAAVVWSFGDLGRATYKTDLIMAAAVAAAAVFFFLNGWRYNAMLSGDAAAAGLGVNVRLLRVLSLFSACLITAVCVSFLGVISFVGIICPHIVRMMLGQDHRLSLPASALCGSALMLLADTLARTVGGGSALPVGAVTALLGAPFFLFIIFYKRGGKPYV